jgi:predicted dehydrogenase
MTQPDRREFGKQAVAGVTAAIAATKTSPARTAANERIGVGCVGVGGRASFLVSAFAEQKDVDLIALADIDSRRLPSAVAAVKGISGRTPATHTDFRKLVDDKTIDVLVVGTPDHWHAIPTIMACQAGKDVYVEKPDGHNIVEGQRMVAAAKKHERLIQLGTQSRTSEYFHAAMDYIRSGKLGRVLFAKSWESARQGAIGRPPDGDPPQGVDYDMWLGPAPKKPFNPVRFHGNWRWFFDLGTGDLGNDGVHRLDVARWALATAVESEGGRLPTLPTKISATGGKWYFDDLQEWPDTLQVNYEFAGDNGKPARILTYEMRLYTPYPYNGEGEGVILYGDQGYIVIGNSRWRAYNPKHQVVAQGSGSNDGHTHIRNFLDCTRSRKRPNADLETVGHPSSVLCHAGNISWRVGRTLVLDPATETFIGDDAANALRTRPEYRKPWTLPEV